MDWNAAIEKNREALKRVLAMLVAMAGLAGCPDFTSPAISTAPCSACCVRRRRPCGG